MLTLVLQHSRGAQGLNQTLQRASKVLRTAAKRQALLLTPPPNSCQTTSLSSVATPRWRSSMASCICTRPSESQLPCLFVASDSSPVSAMDLCFLSSCSKMTSLTEDVRRSAMVCILTVPATMTSHDLMKLMAPFNDVMEHMKIIRDSTPNQYMVLIKFCTQVRWQISLCSKVFFT